MKKSLASIAATAAITLALTGCSSTSSSKTAAAKDDSSITINGLIIANARTLAEGSESCHFSVPSGNFSGKKITVRDANSTIVATHTIASGTLNSYRNQNKLAMACNFPFAILNVPVSKFYEIDFAGKDTKTYTLEEVRRGLKVRYNTDINTP